MMDLTNTYAEQIDLIFGKDSDGIEYPGLNSLEAVGHTRLSKKINGWIFDIINQYAKQIDAHKILHFMSSNIGAFSTFRGTSVRHYDCDPLTQDKKTLVERASNDGKCLLLLDYSDFWNLIGDYSRYAQGILTFIGKNDSAFICCQTEQLSIWPENSDETSDLNHSLNIRKIAKNSGLFIHAIFCFNTRQIFGKLTEKTDSATPLGLPFEDEMFYLVLLSKEPTENEFIYETNSHNKSGITNSIENLIQGKSPETIDYGFWVKPGTYRGAQHRKATQRIAVLENELQPYPLMHLSELIEKTETINNVTFEDLNKYHCNKLLFSSNGYFHYPPLHSTRGYSRVTKGKFEIITLNKTIISEKYLYFFFDSLTGSELLSLIRQVSGEKFYVDTLKHIKVPLPELALQENIVNSLTLFATAKSKIQDMSIEFRNCLHSSDGNYSSLGKIKQVIEIFDELSEYEKTMRLIHSGESKTLEFKQTLSLCIKKKTNEKYVEDSCIKTVAAFLNSEGGTLLIGVNDEGRVSGLEEELSKLHKSSKDKFLLYFKNKIKDRIGAEFYPFIDQNIIECEGKKIFRVDCKKSPTAVYVDSSDFYVRTNPATDKLSGPKVVEYIRNHFKSI